MLVQLVVLSLRHRKHLKPRYQVQINLLRGMLRNRNIIILIIISEYQRFLVNLKQVHLFLDHGIILRSVSFLSYLRKLPFKTVREPFSSYGSSISLTSIILFSNFLTRSDFTFCVFAKISKSYATHTNCFCDKIDFHGTRIFNHSRGTSYDFTS